MIRFVIIHTQIFEMIERDGKITVIENPHIFRASDMPKVPLNLMAENYRLTWAKAGIYLSFDEALNKVSAFNPKNIFLLMNTGSTELYAQLYTSPLFVKSIQDFITRFPTYKSIEESARKDGPEGPNIIVCFSLNCLDGFRTIDDTGREISLARAMLTISQTAGARKVAYSFIPNLIPGALPTSAQGPVAMHEALGGLRVADLVSSRPEHVGANGHNVIVVYPLNANEKLRFDQIKLSRQESPSAVKLKVLDNAIFFEDVPEIF